MVSGTPRGVEAIFLPFLSPLALDMQAQAKEREERLQLVEYELRLAKEDLAEMHKRLEKVRPHRD